jgi:hypothetical protein
MRGNRIQSIVNELQGEKIDVVRWDKDPKVFLANALSPSEVVHVEINEADGSALVVVPERQLSLAIGKEGQNARLAAKLTNCRLDIKSMAEWEIFRTERQAAEEESRRTALAVGEPGAETEPVMAEVGAEAGVEAAEPIAAQLEAPVAQEPEVATPVAQGAEVMTVEAPVAQEVAPPPKEVAEVAAAEALADGLSAEELALLALEEEDELEQDDEDEEEDEEEEPEEIGAEVWTMPAVPAGAGTIRFAEDIMGDFRGGGRGRRGRGGQAGAKGKKGARGKKARTQVEEA